MTTNLLTELEHTTLVRRLIGHDSMQVKEAFFANYLAGLLILRLQDIKGLHLIRDRNTKLSKFTNMMSDVSFWGRALFYPTDPLVKKNLQHGHADLLASEAGRILDSRVEKTMKVLQTAPDQVNWTEVVGGLIILRHRFELNSSYFDRIARALHNWDRLNDGSKRKAVSDSFMFLAQSDNKSNLLGRMRELAGTTMMNDISALARKMVSVNRLKEDGEAVSAGGGTSAANIGTSSGGSGNAILTRGAAPTPAKSDSPAETHDQAMDRIKKYKKLAPNQVGKKDLSKLIKKRPKRFKAIKFRAPKHLMVKKETE
jgi:hypothetical protein